MAKHRIKISSDNIPETIVTPTWGGELAKKRERDRAFYRHELKSDIVMIGSDFSLISDLSNDCEVVTLAVERYCGDEWAEYWQGSFTKFDVKFDYDRCKATVTPKPTDAYACFLREWEELVNIYGIGSNIVVRSFHGIYEPTVHCCKEIQPTTDPCADWMDSCIEFNTATPTGDFGSYLVQTCWHRVVGTGTPTTPPPYGDPGDWTYISGNNWWRCPSDEEINVGVLKKGRLFNSVLQYLVDSTGCGLTVRSHFFGIEATHAAPPDNDAYDYATANYQHLTIHQKSDVKRPDATNPSLSFIWRIKLKELLADLQTIFNVFWKIDGTDLIIEHASYFEAEPGSDYSAKPIKRQVSYEGDLPRMEKFFWSDEYCTTLFAGDPITYNCGEQIEERRVSLFSTDILFIRSLNGEENQDKIADENWALISTSVFDGVYGVNNQNESLAWTNLHDKLHRHYRPFGAGTLNGDNVTFLSTQKNRKAPAFSVGLCCDEEFDETSLVTTKIGDGQVQQATYNIFTDKLTLELNY